MVALYLVYNQLCLLLLGTINVVVISLENGGYIISKLFPKEKATKVTGSKQKATRLDLVNIFWPSDENGV